MHRFIEIVKTHPLAILGGVIIGVAIIFLATRGGGATVTPTYASNDNNNAAINAALVAEQDQARVAGNIAALQYASADHATDAALAAYKVAADSHASDNATMITMQTNQNATALAYQAAANTVTLDQNQKNFALATDANTKQYNLSMDANQKSFDIANTVNAYTNNLSQIAAANAHSEALANTQAQLIGQQYAAAVAVNTNYTKGLTAAYRAGSYDGANNAGAKQLKGANNSVKRLFG